MKAKNILIKNAVPFAMNHKFSKMENATSLHAQKVLIGIKCFFSVSVLILMSMLSKESANNVLYKSNGIYYLSSACAHQAKLG